MNDSHADVLATGALAPGRAGLAVGTTSVLVDEVDRFRVDLDHEVLSMPSPFGTYLVWAETGVGGRGLEFVLSSLVHAVDELGDHQAANVFAGVDAAIRRAAVGCCLLPSTPCGRSSSAQPMAMFAGRHAIVTGGSSGLGRSVAALLAERGAGVSLVALDAAQLERAAVSITGQGNWEVADVTDRLAGVFGYAAYAPSKSAVRGLMEVLRSELQPHGIHVGCVFPPDMDTPGFTAENRARPEEGARVSAGIKPRRPEEVARAVVRGIERRRFLITADPQTAVLARGAGLLAPVLRRVARPHYQEGPAGAIRTALSWTVA